MRNVSQTKECIFSGIPQTRKWERYPNLFQRLHETLLSLFEDLEIVFLAVVSGQG